MSLIREQSRLISRLQKTIEGLNAKLELSEKSKPKIKDVAHGFVKDIDNSVQNPISSSEMSENSYKTPVPVLNGENSMLTTIHSK